MTGEETKELDSLPNFNTREELKQFIDTLLGANPESQDILATATWAMFRFVAEKLNVSRAQASLAMLRVLQKVNSDSGPCIMFYAEDELQLNYDANAKLKACQATWKPWIASRAIEKMLTSNKRTAPEVLLHWAWLANESPAPSRSTRR